MRLNINNKTKVSNNASKTRQKIKKPKDPKVETINQLRKAAERNQITTKSLNKLNIPEHLHDVVRITAQKIHGKNFIFVDTVSKKVSIFVKGSVIIVSGVTAMQIPRLVKQFQQNKILLERHGVEYKLSEFLSQDLKNFQVAVEVPKNVFSKQSWTEYAQTNGVSFASGAILSATALALLNGFIKRKINNLRIKKELKKSGNL